MKNAFYQLKIYIENETSFMELQISVTPSIAKALQIDASEIQKKNVS